MKNRVYVALVEIVPLPGCEVDPEEVAGVATRCYVLAESKWAAMRQIEKALEDEFFRLEETEWCVAYDETEWENPDDPTARDMVSEADRTGEVVLGELHCWGHDVLDADD